MTTIDYRVIQKAFSEAAESYGAHSVVQKFAEDVLLERLDELSKPPQSVLDLGAGPGRASHLIKKKWAKAEVVSLDLSTAMLKKIHQKNGVFRKVRTICANAQDIPLQDQSVDLIFSNLMMQWIAQNQLPAFFNELRRVLKPGGLVFLSTLGSSTLHELRSSWRQVDTGSHVNEFQDLHDLGDGLIAAGFAQTVVDAEFLTLTYSNIGGLFKDLKGIGASNHLPGRQKGLMGKQAFSQMKQHYEQFRVQGVLPATWEIVNLHAIAPDLSQPIRHGTIEEARFSLEDLKQTLKKNHDC